jgi:ER lumen protein retaining receptor
MFNKFKHTYDRNHDTFRIDLLVLPSAILAFYINHQFEILEIFWTFSIYLESFAVLPQLFMISKIGVVESKTSHYLLMLGAYRAMYIMNWVYRFHHEGYYDSIAMTAAIVQTILYCDFFYLYIRRGLLNREKNFSKALITIITIKNVNMFIYSQKVINKHQVFII